VARSDARGHAAFAAKEALLEQNLRVTDFHDESSVAWAALDRFQSPAKDAVAAASVTLRELEDTNALAASKGARSLDLIYIKFLDATGLAKDLTLAAKVARDRAESFQNAATQASKARDVLATRARKVSAAADTVMADVVWASNAARKSLTLSGEIRYLAVRVKTAANEDRMADAEDLMRNAQDKLKTASGELSNVVAAREDARTHGRDVYAV
jgi:hypothetical protein